jgi:hypothetical protein
MQKEQVPQTVISNGLINARLYLPDIENGYYRGTRFDWSGVIASLECSGHNYFGQWFEQYSPTLHDAIMGPVDDFTPVGYNEAKIGETFLKIGIGMVIKPDEQPYAFSRTYQITDNGKWKVRTNPDQVQFVHTLKEKNYNYEYEKVVRLLKDKPSLILSHIFRNRGDKTIETFVYNHNFFVINNQPVGPGFSATFPFVLSGVFKDGADIAELRDKSIILNRDLAKGETVFCERLTGFGQSAKDYDIRIENKTTNAGVRTFCDRPLAKMVFWSCPTTFCPEPYILIKAEPGRDFSWNIQYDFYKLQS